MLQVYLLTEAFLIYSAALVLSDTFGTVFLSLINLHNFIYKKKIAKTTTLIVCSSLIIANIFLPVSPGPMVLGDFLPVVTLLSLLLFFLKRFSKEENFIDIYKKYDFLGYISLAVALIHFLFPGFVIL